MSKDRSRGIGPGKTILKGNQSTPTNCIETVTPSLLSKQFSSIWTLFLGFGARPQFPWPAGHHPI